MRSSKNLSESTLTRILKKYPASVNSAKENSTKRVFLSKYFDSSPSTNTMEERKEIPKKEVKRGRPEKKETHQRSMRSRRTTPFTSAGHSLVHGIPKANPNYRKINFKKNPTRSHSKLKQVKDRRSQAPLSHQALSELSFQPNRQSPSTYARGKGFEGGLPIVDFGRGHLHQPNQIPGGVVNPMTALPVNTDTSQVSLLESYSSKELMQAKLREEELTEDLRSHGFGTVYSQYFLGVEFSEDQHVIFD